MMGYGYGAMMGGFGTPGLVIYLVILADAILLGAWLWKQINK